MAAATSRYAKTQQLLTQQLLDGVPLSDLGLRLSCRGQRVELMDDEGHVVASIAARAGAQELGALFGAVLSHGRNVGRREAFAAMRARLGDRLGACE